MLGQRYDDGRTVTLHVGHDLSESHGGKATIANCVTLFARCNEAESNIPPDRPQISKTIVEVRKLAKVQQLVIYEILKSVFSE